MGTNIDKMEIIENIELDGKDVIHLNNVTIIDKDLYELLSIKQGLERVEIFNQIVRAGTIGIMAIKGFTISERVEKEFIDLQKRFEYMVREQLGNNVKDIFDINNPDSSFNKLVGIVNKSVTSNSVEYKKAFDKGFEDIIGKVNDIEIKIAENKGRKEIYDKSTQKGGDFEDSLHYFLNSITANNFDNVNRISTTYGLTGTKGDFIIDIYGIKKKILIEAKTEPVNLNKANKYIDECLKNWPETAFSILVYKEDPNGALKGIRFEQNNRIICEFGNEGLMLEAAYRIARIYLDNEYKNLLTWNKKVKEYNDTISNINTFGITRVRIKYDIKNMVQYINNIVTIRNNLTKSFNSFSDSFDKSIIDMDEFKRNIVNRLRNIEKMLDVGEDEKDLSKGIKDNKIEEDGQEKEFIEEDNSGQVQVIGEYNRDNKEGAGWE